MDQTSPASTNSQASTWPSPGSPSRLPLLSLSFVALSATLISTGGCSSEPTEPGDDVSVSTGGGAVGVGGGTGPGTGGLVGSGAAPGTGSGGSGGVAAGTGGAGPGTGGSAVGSGGAGTGGEPCVDLEPPYDPDWPDATCPRWATESEPPACDAPWFAEYCNISCGRCVPEGGVPEPPEEPCEDKEPPYDPEWPEATCSSWANETEPPACDASWFSEYCDISCGRCVPEGGLPPEPMAPDCSGEGLPAVNGQVGFATRYWDCCQTHCSQFNGQRCGQDGVSGTGDSNSACTGGGSFACYSEAPYAVSECLSYGHIAKSNPDCGGCYRIEFTGEGEHNANDPGSKLIKGKQMVVKVSNTGGDVAGNQFDLMIPGGGVGQFNACSRQWGTNDLGAQYGGFLSECSGSHEAKKECVRQECMKIPAGEAREGCLWFVDWFQVADNPKFTWQSTSCPF